MTQQANLMLGWLRRHEAEMVESLEQLVRIESSSLDPAALERSLDFLTGELRSVDYRTRRFFGNGTAAHLVARPEQRRRHAPYQLVSGHVDTVWPLGSVERNPPRVEQGRLYGPGAYDMKGGLVQLLFALRALQALELDPPVVPVILVNTDEEVGSMGSLSHLRLLARRAVRAFVLEPPAGKNGELKTGRKGVGRFRVTVHGRAAHAGSEPERGVSAILELSHQIQRLYALNDRARGVTVNVGTVDGGLRPNIVAPDATAFVDVRAPKVEDMAELEATIRGLVPVQPGISVSVTGGFDRPPMMQTVRNRALCRRAQRLAEELGLDVREAPIVGGASDANLISDLTPTLDGLGAVGNGAHAADENVIVSALPERAALLAMLLADPADPIPRQEFSEIALRAHADDRPAPSGDTDSMIASKPHETGDMLVITCRVPYTDIADVSLAVDGHRVVVTAPGGFRHELALPAEADMSRLGVELYRGILELRAPHASASGTTALVA